MPPPAHSLPLPSPTSLTTQTKATIFTKPSTRNYHNANYALPDFPSHMPLPDLPSHMKQKIIALEIIGVDSGRALALNPAIRDSSPDSLHSVVSYLRSNGVHHNDLARILGMCPQILTLDPRSDLAPVFAFLSQDLDVPDKTGVRRSINKCPRLLISSVRHQLRPALHYLQHLGFLDNAALAYQDPILLVSNVDRTLKPKLKFLSTGLGIPLVEAIGMVLRCPALFTFSIENNFKPKFGYLVGEMGGDLDEVKEFPQFFAFSLEKRIKPRHLAMAEAGLRLSLPAMLKSTDKEFDELIRKERERQKLV